MSILNLLNRMLENGAVDLYLTEGVPPIWRDEKIIEKGDRAFSQQDLFGFAHSILSSEQFEKFQQEKELNHAFEDELGNRYRLNFFYQRQNLGIVIRRIRKEIPDLDILGLPDVFKHSIMLKHGLVLVVGGAGSGKSTSVAAMLNFRNENSYGHIVTVEDPIEFTHQHKNCIFSQREIGIDTNSWDEALKNALRQRPDVVYIGEIREKTTMQHAMTFAETGHLVIATMHATSASQAIERIANLTPEVEKTHRLYNLSNVLKVVIGQRLVPAKDGGMTLAMDILRNDGLIKPLIAEGRIEDLRELMFRNSDMGMMTFDISLLRLHKEGLISEETAVLFADQAENVRLELLKKSMSNSSQNIYTSGPLSKNEF